MIRIFGIKNCNTMKKAFDWLEAHGVAYEFHDYKKSGASVEQLSAWAGKVGWEKLLNTKGMTWRNLAEHEREGMNEERAIALMSTKPSVIKRPVIEHAGKLLIGFDEAIYAQELEH